VDSSPVYTVSSDLRTGSTSTIKMISPTTSNDDNVVDFDVDTVHVDDPNSSHPCIDISVLVDLHLRHHHSLLQYPNL
jgi:hypothetical protein